MSSQLLGELLLDRHNFTIMTKYISKPENLKLMMNLLRDKSRNIQFEAFHVFKVQCGRRRLRFPPEPSSPSFTSNCNVISFVLVIRVDI